MNKKTFTIVTIAAVAALLIATATITTTSDSAFAKKYKKTQTTAQENSCGNGALPLDIFCQTISNMIQGDDNAVNVIGVQPH
jgi:hypothetical protein